MKKIALLTLGLLMVCNCAFATFSPADIPTYEQSLGDIALGSPESVMKNNINGDFYHKYTMSLPYSDFNIAVVSIDFDKFSNISNFAAYLYKDDGDSNYSKIFEIFGDTLSTTTTNLLAGNYFLAITGSGSGNIGGFYSGFLTATAPVPVPAAALLLGAGLLGIVGVRRRQLS